MDVYTYKYENNTYINLTNQCTNRCEFCIRNTSDGVGGYNLWLTKEPSAQQVMEQLEKDPTDIIFCGYGEPTIKLEELKEVAAYAKSYGGKVRLNTNGHANVFHGRNIVPELLGKVDEISISLNGATPKQYADITHCDYGEAGFKHMLEFARHCVQAGIAVKLSVVDVIEQSEINSCREIARNIGAQFRVRTYAS